MFGKFEEKLDNLADMSYDITISAIVGVIIGKIFTIIFLPLTILFKKLRNDNFLADKDRRYAIHKATAYYKQHGRQCPGCHKWIPDDDDKYWFCPLCGTPKKSTEELTKEIDNFVNHKDVDKKTYEYTDTTNYLDIGKLDYSFQEKPRKKYAKIRCPKCGSISRILEDLGDGLQIRRCNKHGHIFQYDYRIQANMQVESNWQVKI